MATFRQNVTLDIESAVAGLRSDNRRGYSAALVQAPNQMLQRIVGMNKRPDIAIGDGSSLNRHPSISPGTGKPAEIHLPPSLANRQLRVPADQSVPTWHLRSRSSQALLNSELQTHWSELWNIAPVGFIVVDASGSIISLNGTACRLLSIDPAHATSLALAAVVPPDQARLVKEFLANVFRDATTQNLEVSTSIDGSPSYLRLSVASVATLTASLTLLDITDLKRLETEQRETQVRLAQLQRLEVVHTMSAGIAHDFKNVMQVIESYAAILAGGLRDRDPDHGISREIMTAASRGTLLANRWLAFCRDGKLLSQPVNMAEFIKQRMARIEQTWLQRVATTVSINDPSLVCQLDPCLMEQVLMNLCINARDAMGEDGRLHVQVDRFNVACGPEKSDFLPPGVYAKVSIADNGHGIPADAIERIFEPFYSTKSSSAGTGLGLTLVRGIISEHQGAMEVQSQVGLGSVFTIYMPAE